MDIIVCGDSHSGVFNSANKQQDRYNFSMSTVGSSTAYGLLNPSSRTSAAKHFIAKLDGTTADKLIFMLGEVDCGYLIWAKAKRDKTSVDDQIRKSIANYFTFIDQAVNTSKHYVPMHIIVTGVILPIIEDMANPKNISEARCKLNISIDDRTAKTLLYNRLLQEECMKRNYSYIEITNLIRDADGRVKKEYLRANPYDHHLDFHKSAPLWISKIDELLRDEQCC